MASNGKLSLNDAYKTIYSFAGYPDHDGDVWVSDAGHDNAQATVNSTVVDSKFAASFAINMLALDVKNNTTLDALLKQHNIFYSAIRTPVVIERYNEGEVHLYAESFLSLVCNKLLLRPEFTGLNLNSYMFGSASRTAIYLNGDEAAKMKFWLMRRVGFGGTYNNNDALCDEDYSLLTSLGTVNQDELNDYISNSSAQRAKSIDAYSKYRTTLDNNGTYWTSTFEGLPVRFYITFDEILLARYTDTYNTDLQNPIFVKQVKGLKLYVYYNEHSSIMQPKVIYEDKTFNVTVNTPAVGTLISNNLVKNFQLSNSTVEYYGGTSSSKLTTRYNLNAAYLKDIKYQTELGNLDTNLFERNNSTVITDGDFLKTTNSNDNSLVDVSSSQLTGAATTLYTCNMLLNIGYVKRNEEIHEHTGVLADIGIVIDVCNYGSAGHYPVCRTDHSNTSVETVNYNASLDSGKYYFPFPSGVTLDNATIDSLVTHYNYVLLPLEEAVMLYARDQDNNYYYREYSDSTKRVKTEVVIPLNQVTQESLDVALDTYKRITNNKFDKSMFRTPMEYYNTNTVEQKIEGYEEESLSNGTNSSTGSTPTYFWVETLKNWCTFGCEVIAEDECNEAELRIWNGVNAWLPLANIIAYYRDTFVPIERVKTLDLTKQTDLQLFQNFCKILTYKQNTYNFPIEQLHTVEIDRVYHSIEPNLAGKSRSFLESLGHGVMTGLRGLGNVGKGLFQDFIAIPASLFTDKNAWEYMKEGWTNVFTGWTQVFDAIFNMPVNYVVEQILEAIGYSGTNFAFYNVPFGKRLYARCYYLKLPYDSGYSSNDATTYQTVRIPKRAAKAYGAIDGGIMRRTACAAYNVIPTTIGSPFMTRSSTGELMIAYKMAYTGPIREKYDSHEDLYKKSGIMPIDVEFSNQLLRKTLGSGEDKTINDWLTTFADNDAIESKNLIYELLQTTMSNNVVEQHNQEQTAMASMKITANRSKTNSDVDITEINTLTKW